MTHTSFQEVYAFALRAAQIRAAAAPYAFATANRQDMVQEALVAVWQALSKYDASRASLRTFLEMVIARRFISIIRSHRMSPYGNLRRTAPSSRSNISCLGTADRRPTRSVQPDGARPASGAPVGRVHADRGGPHSRNCPINHVRGNRPN